MIDPATIIRVVCDLFGVAVADLMSPRRYKRLTPARQAAAWALRQVGLSLVEVGGLLQRDHTTIIYSVRQAEALARVDAAYAARLRILAAAIRPSDPPPAPPVRTPTQRAAVALTPQLRLSLSFWGVAMPRTA